MPSGVFAPVLSPPCSRQRPFAIAGHRQGAPRRVLAPQRAALAKSPEGLPFRNLPRRCSWGFKSWQIRDSARYKSAYSLAAAAWLSLSHSHKRLQALTIHHPLSSTRSARAGTQLQSTHQGSLRCAPARAFPSTDRSPCRPGSRRNRCGRTASPRCWPAGRR
jgi:hypothetical protein